MLEVLKNGSKCAIIAFCAAVAVAWVLVSQAEENMKAEVNTLRADIAALRADIREWRLDQRRENRALQSQIFNLRGGGNDE